MQEDEKGRKKNNVRAEEEQIATGGSFNTVLVFAILVPGTVYLVYCLHLDKRVC